MDITPKFLFKIRKGPHLHYFWEKFFLFWQPHSILLWLEKYQVFFNNVLSQVHGPSRKSRSIFEFLLVITAISLFWATQNYTFLQLSGLYKQTIKQHSIGKNIGL